MIFNDENAPGFPVIVAMHINPTGGAEGPWAPWTGTLSVGDIEIGAVENKNYNTDDRVYISPTHQMSVHTTDDQTFVETTGAVAVNIAVAPGAVFDLEQVTIHLSAVGGAAAGNLTITCDSGTAAVYDVNLLTQSMVAVQDYVYQPARPLRFQAGDVIDIVWANPNSVTYGITAVWTTH